MLCPKCRYGMVEKWEELFGRLWVCEECNEWVSEAWDKQLESGIPMGSPVILPEQGETNAGS